MWGATVLRVIEAARQEFQSTRPVWGATGQENGLRAGEEISIHAPRVGRDVGLSRPTIALYISIHAPRVGRDPYNRAARKPRRNFNPRAPCGARLISSRVVSCHIAFQSTRPVWGATAAIRWLWREQGFQSTRPVWGATLDSLAEAERGEFQSTRPVWGATPLHLIHS